MNSPLLLAGLLCILCGAAVHSYEITNVTAPVDLGESPFWDDATNTVIFVDISGKQVLRYDPKHPNDLKSVSLNFEDGAEGRVTPAVPIRGTDQLLVGVGLTVYLVRVDWGAPGEKPALQLAEPLATVDQNAPGNRFNDGKADKQGRLWLGTMDNSHTSRSDSSRGSLYRFDLLDHSSSLEPHRVLTDMQIPNGMAWTDDGLGYYLADSNKLAVYRYDFHSDAGTLGDGRLVFSFEEHNVTGAPDGLTIDQDGNLWIACVHGWAVIQVDPRTNTLLKTIQMPVAGVSAPEWGGPNRDILYVTTSRYQLTAEQLRQQPLAGSMFTITGLGTRGYPYLPYAASTRSSSSCQSPWGSAVTLLLVGLVILLNKTSTELHS